MNALEFVKETMMADEGEGCDLSPESIHDYLVNQPLVYEENKGKHRWYIDTFCVTTVAGRIIGYTSFDCTGDGCDGWEFDENSVCFAEKYEVTVTKWRKEKP